ncbi:hypothetical protein HPP92_028815 [Vanilla planifolia]|uniref:Uncharacterized protein n=1 Tax=Vanilla planifolia TaxID=51239 RepID=A0A835P5Y2_VANPL|nr:hypothetical protein HPP92_028815 [Vanilla planifolia]KAG0446487.1 hypothetical protein HPP92_028804 [Vanilla planifolia]
MKPDERASLTRPELEVQATKDSVYVPCGLGRNPDYQEEERHGDSPGASPDLHVAGSIADAGTCRETNHPCLCSNAQTNTFNNLQPGRVTSAITAVSAK